KDDSHAATLHFVTLVARGGVPPLLLATTLPIAPLADIKGIVRLYTWRWAIGSAFETLQGWGLGRFMVRVWKPSTGCCGWSQTPTPCVSRHCAKGRGRSYTS